MSETATKKKQELDDCVHEYPQLGDHRVRMIETGRGAVVLDIREFIDKENFVGFTRKGIRLDLTRAVVLRNLLTLAIEDGHFKDGL